MDNSKSSEHDYLPRYALLYQAVSIGDWDTARKFLNNHPEAVAARISVKGKTALHIAALFGHLHIVEELVKLLSVEEVELLDVEHITALHEATYSEIIEIAKCLVEKNKKLLTIPTGDGSIPVTRAIDAGHKGMGRYLYSATPREELAPEKGNHGATLLNLCYYSKMFDMALDLLKHFPSLAITPDRDGSTFLHALASIPSAFPSGCQFALWQRWIYDRVHIQQKVAYPNNDIFVNMPETSISESDIKKSTRLGLLHRLASYALNLLGMKNIYEIKLSHEQSLELLRMACHELSGLNEEQLEASGVHLAVLRATERGIPEFIIEALKVHIHLLWGFPKPLFCAVQFRQAKVFSLIHGIIWKHAIANERDNGNTLLHMAGMLAPARQLHHIPGAALQMQRELQWFKEVESIMPPMRKESLNKDHMTARDLFTKNHKDLVIEGEKWMKGTANSCSFVAALVATIVFTAAFTVSFGGGQNTDFSMSSNSELFMLFIMSDAVSLFSSSTSVLMFLSILTSRYAEEDFLKSLPTKLIIGLSTLFISLATMMIAFCASLFIMLRGKEWIVIPVILLASVPVSLFVWLQFPLLLEISMSTYGPSIFHRDVKRWL